MKVRYGFVSNSSSSSFVVHNPDRTTAQTMREMLKLVRAEGVEERYGKQYINPITKCIIWLQSHPKTDKPLLYPNTCNYETWVYKNKNGDLCIDTCNNHDSNWESMDFDYRNDDNYESDRAFMKSLKFLDLIDMIEKTYDEWELATFPDIAKYKKAIKKT